MRAEQGYDVVVCGAGLAGLTLARLLWLRSPSLRIVLLDKESGALEPGHHKVGESTVEGATYWFSHTLGLEGYLREHHITKLGLRFFGGGGAKRFDERFEMGAPEFPPVPAMAIERGLMETYLRDSLRSAGVEILEGVLVTDVELGEGDAEHRVAYRSPERSEAGEIRGRWLVDATGGRRMLAARLGLDVESEPNASACFWWVEGRCDIEPLIPEGRPVKHPRWLSTNHILGDGYWVWLIPLSTEQTSIGIVADEERHPIKERSTLPRAMQWLREHEPHLAQVAEPRAPEGFQALRRYSRRVERVFSEDRWALVGVSAMFSDPLYSSGSDLIAIAASLVTKMIELDRAGGLTPELVRLYDRVVQGSFELFNQQHAQSYRQFHNDMVALLKVTWDGLTYFTFPTRMLLQEIAFDDPQILEQYDALARELLVVDHRVQTLLADWTTARPHHRVPPGFYHPSRCPALRRLLPMVAAKEEPAEFIERQREFLRSIRHIAQAIFYVAVGYVHPDQLHRLEPVDRIDPRTMQLDPTTWERTLAGPAEGDPAAIMELVEQLQDFLTKRWAD